MFVYSTLLLLRQTKIIGFYKLILSNFLISIQVYFLIELIMFSSSWELV